MRIKKNDEVRKGQVLWRFFFFNDFTEFDGTHRPEVSDLNPAPAIIQKS